MYLSWIYITEVLGDDFSRFGSVNVFVIRISAFAAPAFRSCLEAENNTMDDGLVIHVRVQEYLCLLDVNFAAFVFVAGSSWPRRVI